MADATPADWAFVHELRRTLLFDMLHGVDYDPDRPGDRAPSNRPFVFLLDDRPIGTVRLDLMDDRRAAMRLVAIVPDRQRQGHGSALVAAIERLAVEAGATLMCTNAYVGAVGFYASLGYQRAAWTDPAHIDDGLPDYCAQMTKIIAGADSAAG